MIQQEAVSMGRSRTRDMVLFSMFTALIALGAFIRIPVPICPLTMQLFFTALAGLILGGKRGAAAVGVYVLLGLIGVPVFTQGGGPEYIFQPTFGYLVGFIIGTGITGWLRERAGRVPGFRYLLGACLAGLVVIYIFGVLYIYIISNYYLNLPIGLWPVVLHGCLVSIPGDLVKCAMAAEVARRFYRSGAAAR